MYITLIITFLLLLAIVIGGIQNTMPIDLKFILWEHRTSVTALIFYSSLIGAAVVAVLTLPKHIVKSFKLRRLTREIHVLKKRLEEKEEEKESSSLNHQPVTESE